MVAALNKAGGKRDINAKDLETEQTPLHLAVLGGKDAAARELLMLGANVNAINADKDHPLHLAIEGFLSACS